MGTFRPRELLEQAQKAEANGELRLASNHYATLGTYLIGKKRWKDAITALEKAVALSPAAPRLYIQLAIAQKGMGEKDLAKSAALFFTRRATQNRKFGSYKEYVQRELSEHPELREAVFEEYLNFDRTNVDPFLDLIDALLAQERWVRALEVALDALQFKERNAEVLQAIGKCLMGLGRNEQQIFVERFAEGKLSHSELRVLLASQSVQETVDAEEKGLDAMIMELEHKLGIRLEEPYGNIQKVVDEFRSKSNAVLGNSGRARLDMATAFKEMGLWKEALEELAMVESHDPNFLQCRFLTGEILSNQGSDLAALEAFQAILRVADSRDSLALESRYRVMQLYLKFGDYKSALTACLILEKADPQYRDLKALKTNIQNHLRTMAE